MANPSLQIGNSNWAIKEDNLLGYSTAGTRFVPQPITMTRASLGTRVNLEDLVEDVALLGSELITDGDFPTGTTAWSMTNNTGTNTRIENNHLIIETDGAYTQAEQLNVTVGGNQYKLVYTVLNSDGGDLALVTEGNTPSSIPNSVGTHIYYFTSHSTSFILKRRSGALNITITNVSVKEATIDNLPRVDYTDGTSSLLVEPQRRNLVTYSEVISNQTLITGGTGTYTITDNYTDSPEGVQNASRVQISIVDTDDTSNYRAINIGSVMTTGVTREISFYAKSLTGLNQDVLVYWSYDKQIVTLTNDWQRFEISGTSANSGAVFIGTRGGTTQYYAGGDANLDFALWGLQVEDDGSGGGSSYPTSYIKTSGSRVTRVQETYTKTGISDLINSEEGVLFVEMAALSDDSTDRRITMSDGTTQNRMAIGFDNASNKIKYFLISSNTIQVNKDISVSNITQFNKIAFKYKLNDFALWVNGVEVDTDTSGSTFSANTLSVLRFAGYLGTSQNFYGKVKQLQVFKTALSDSELATLTS